MSSSLRPIDCSLSGSSIHEILRERILEWIAISFSKGSSRPRDGTHVSCISCFGRWILYYWATREAQYLLKLTLKASVSPPVFPRMHTYFSVETELLLLSFISWMNQDNFLLGLHVFPLIILPEAGTALVPSRDFLCWILLSSLPQDYSIRLSSSREFSSLPQWAALQWSWPTLDHFSV